jgi:hypothetical protein
MTFNQGKRSEMTDKQKQHLEQKIKRIRAALAYEKRQIGCYDDSRGLRYLPTELYLKLQDYKGGLVYLRWFAKNFPDDAGFPEFLFEWSVILFMNGKVKEAEKKVVEAYFRNTYILDKFFGRPIQPIDKSEYSNICTPEYTQYFKYSADKPELADFCEFLSSLEQSAKFQSIKDRFIKAMIRLKTEKDPEMRHHLVRIDRELLSELK